MSTAAQHRGAFIADNTTTSSNERHPWNLLHRAGQGPTAFRTSHTWPSVKLDEKKNVEALLFAQSQKASQARSQISAWFSEKNASTDSYTTTVQSVRFGCTPGWGNQSTDQTVSSTLVSMIENLPSSAVVVSLSLDKVGAVSESAILPQLWTSIGKGTGGKLLSFAKSDKSWTRIDKVVENEG